MVVIHYFASLSDGLRGSRRNERITIILLIDDVLRARGLVHDRVRVNRVLLHELDVLLVAGLGRGEGEINVLDAEDFLHSVNERLLAQISRDEDKLALALISGHLAVKDERLRHGVSLLVPRVSNDVVVIESSNEVVGVYSTVDAHLGHDDARLAAEPHVLVLRGQIFLSLFEHFGVLSSLSLRLSLSGFSGHFERHLGSLGGLGLFGFLLSCKVSQLLDVGLSLGIEVGGMILGSLLYSSLISPSTLLSGLLGSFMLCNQSEGSLLTGFGLVLARLSSSKTSLLGGDSFFKSLLISLSLSLLLLLSYSCEHL